MVNVEISRVGSENSMNVIRKFTRRFQGANIVKNLRGRRYWERTPSKAVKKKGALKRITKRTHIAQLIKEGKIQERAPRGAQRQ